MGPSPAKADDPCRYTLQTCGVNRARVCVYVKRQGSFLGGKWTETPRASLTSHWVLAVLGLSLLSCSSHCAQLWFLEGIQDLD